MQGSLLEDVNLLNALESAKSTAQDIKQQLEISEQNEVKIDHARQGFLPCAIRASLLFFVLKVHYVLHWYCLRFAGHGSC